MFSPSIVTVNHFYFLFSFSWRYNPHWGCILQPSSGL